MKVGELSAHIRLDGKPEFDRGVDDAGRRFQGLGKTAQGVAQGLATGFVAATGTMVGLGAAAFKTGIEYNALQQSSRAALTTLLGSAEAANAQMDKLDEFARTSPFAKDVFIQAQQQMIGFGIAAEDVIPILSAVQDATAAVGGSNQDISDIVTTLSKISSTGKITAQDLNELGNKGIDAASLMGAEFGKTSGEIREMITKGQISADEAIDAITTQMSVKFGGAAANVKETWDGAVDRIKAAWRDTGSALAAPFVDPNGGGKAIAWANDFADVLRAVQRQVEPIMGVVMARWGSDLDKITPYLQGLKDRIDGLDMSALNKSLDALEGYGPIIAGLSGAFAAWGSAAIPIIGGINPLVAGVTALVMATPELRDEIGGVLSAASPLLPIMSDLGREVADLGMKVIKEVAPAFIELATSVVEAAVPLAGPFAGAVSGLLQIAEPLIGVLADVVGWMAELPDEVLLAGTAFLLLKDHMGPLTGAVNAVRGAFDTLQLRRHLASMEGMTTATALGRGAMMNFSGAVAVAGGALKAAFITNAPALAIAGIVAVLGKMAAASARNKQEIRDLASSFDELGGATDATREQLVAMMRADENWAGLGDNLEDRLNAVGISTREATDALIEGGQAVTDLQNRLREMADAEEAAGNNRRASEIRDMADAIGKLADEYDGAADSARENADASDQAARATEAMARATDGYVSSVESAIDAERRRKGEALTLAEAQVAHAQAIDQMTRAIEDESKAFNEATGEWDAYTAAGQTAISATEAHRQAMWDMAEAMRDQGASAEEITAKLYEMNDGYVDQASKMTGSRESAEQLLDTYGLFPDEIVTLVTADADGAVLEIEGVGRLIATTDGTITLNGEPVPAHQTLGELIGDVDEASGTVDLNGERLPADMTLRDLLKEIDRSSEDVKIGGNSRIAEGERQKVLAQISLARADVNIGARPGPFNDWLARINGRTVGTAYVQVGAVGSGVAMLQADGGVVDYYANGGVRENHVAQIAPAGAWRVWAEPETEGEAYIPLAVSKRARSVQILEEVADRFGLMVVPKGATAFAGGGMNGVPSGGGRVAPAQVGRTVILQVGDREFPAYMEELADGRIAANPGVAAANGLVSNMSRYRAQMGV